MHMKQSNFNSKVLDAGTDKVLAVTYMYIVYKYIQCRCRMQISAHTYNHVIIFEYI